MVGDILLRMSELAAQSSSTTITNTERGYIDSEYQALNTSIATVQGNATLNSQTAFANGVSSVAGPAGDVTTSANAATAATNITTRLASVASNRAVAGSVINNQQFIIQSYETNYENQLAAAASWTPTLPRKPLSCRATRSSSRPARPWSPGQRHPAERPHAAALIQ